MFRTKPSIRRARILGVAVATSALLVVLAAIAVTIIVIRSRTTEALSPEPEEQDPWFEDVTDQVGIDFIADPGNPSAYWQAELHGSGVAVFDCDGDDRLDILLLNFSTANPASICRLYRNQPDGTFRDATAGSGLGITGKNTGVAIGDVDHDGRPDVLITQHHGVRLFRNEGAGRFRDITEFSGLVNPLWGTSASFVDYDRDGWLDLLIVNYLDDDPNWRCYNPRSRRDYCGPRHFPPTVSKLFRNLGPDPKNPSAGVRFQDVTAAAGMATTPGPGLATYCADFTGDGWPDLLIVNDNAPNFFWINQRNGTFTEEAFIRGIALDGLGRALAGMGAAVGDVDNDGLLDIYMTHLNTEGNTLWKQGPKRGYFRDQTAAAGLMNSDWRGTGFGTFMADLNNDGWVDIAVANGAITQGSTTPNPDLGPHFQEYSERNQLFRNLGHGRFQDVSRLNDAFCGTPNVGRALAYGDLDGDGGIDMVLTTTANRARVYRNIASPRGHWLLVRALDPRWQRDAYGAFVRLRVGERWQVRCVNPADSFQSSSDPRAHFGLGQATTFDAIEVLWPDGLNETFPGGAADRVIVLRRGEGTPVGSGRDPGAK